MTTVNFARIEFAKASRHVERMAKVVFEATHLGSPKADRRLFLQGEFLKMIDMPLFAGEQMLPISQTVVEQVTSRINFTIDKGFSLIPFAAY